MNTTAHVFMGGMICTAFLACALFFARFYRATGDRLFALFGIGFAILAVQRAILVFPAAHDGMPYVYLPRLVAYLFILAAIIDRNLRAGRAGAEERKNE